MLQGRYALAPAAELPPIGKPVLPWRPCASKYSAHVRHRKTGLLILLKGNPRARFPWTARTKLRLAVAPQHDRSGHQPDSCVAPSILNSERAAHPSPIADHAGCGAAIAPAPPVASPLASPHVLHHAHPAQRCRHRIGPDPEYGNCAKPSLG